MLPVLGTNGRLLGCIILLRSAVGLRRVVRLCSLLWLPAAILLVLRGLSVLAIRALHAL
ncbi:hypothetical protein GCM10007338_16070 [Corynebacterium pelargi]|nr:hypothetical protein GCM10007338_16070 [Corynebacterium pelargi]